MSQAEINTFAKQVAMKWEEEKRVLGSKTNPGTAFLRTQLRKRREAQRQMQEQISAKLK